MRVVSDNEGMPVVVELTRRNLEVLLAKLNDPLSTRTICDGTTGLSVRAVENSEHYAARAPGVMYMPTSGEFV